MKNNTTYVKVRYVGDLAKNAVALADNGIGYVVLEKGVDKGEKYAMVALTHVYQLPVSPPLIPLTFDETLTVKRVLRKRFNTEDE